MVQLAIYCRDLNNSSPRYLRYASSTLVFGYLEFNRIRRSDAYMCWMFKGKTHQTAKSWFKFLNAGSVSCLDSLITEFIREFGYAASYDQATFKLAFIK